MVKGTEVLSLVAHDLQPLVEANTGAKKRPEEVNAVANPSTVHLQCFRRRSLFVFTKHLGFGGILRDGVRRFILAQEVRSILFTADEIHKAVTQLLMQRIRGLNPNWIDRVEVTLRDGSVRALVHFSKELSTSRPLDAHELMTAMLLYCRQSRIPLSNRAQKRLDVIGGCLSLSSALNLKRIDPWLDGGTIIHAVAEPGLPANQGR